MNNSILSLPHNPKSKPQRIDFMTYLDGMDRIDHEIMDKVLAARENFDCDNVTAKDVERALAKEYINELDLSALLSPVALPYLEKMAQKAQQLTRRHFGNNILFFTPLYISNYCDNHCVYCGFKNKNNIKRVQLDSPTIEKELHSIAQTGLQEILLLTGESQQQANVMYIAQAAQLAKRFFSTVGVEVYPMNVQDYKILQQHGVDFVTVFTETYSLKKYPKIHIEGNKRIFPYRFHAQERALLAGMRGVGFAALLGLDDYKKDAFATALHAHLIQKKYPHAQIALSVPRLRPIIHNANIRPKDVDEKRLLQVICAYRLFLPYATITISTREAAKFRDGAVQIAANKVSAGVHVGVGSHSHNQEQGDEQFEIADTRSVQEVFEDIKRLQLQPVFKDHDYV